jgi:hypothetical protein
VFQHDKKVVFNFLGDFELRFHHAFLDFQSQETKKSPTKKYGEKQIYKRKKQGDKKNINRK